jgi:hypothetical protein
VTASDRAIRAERRALKRAERDRKRAERAARRLRHERIVNGGPVRREQREPTWADLKGLKFLHCCDECGKIFEDESVFEHPCAFCESRIGRKHTRTSMDEPHDEGSRAMRSAPSEAGQGMLF